MKQPGQATKIFDPVKLDAMTEPLFVRVEKVKGSTRSMIPLPAADDGSAQGSNWSKEDVRGLEQWLVNDWSGGGMYAITVSDATTPTPQKMDWSIWYNPSDYPEKVPPTLSAAVAEPRSTPLQQQVRMASYPSAFSGGFPPGLNFPTPQFFTPTQTQPQFRGVDPAIAAAQFQADAERRRLEDQIRDMNAQLQRAREETIQSQYKQELARQEQAQNDRFAKLEQMMAAQIAQAQRPVVDPQVEALKAQLEKAERDREADRREREAERREHEMKELIARQAEESRRQFELFQQQIAQNRAPDPVITFLQEHARQQAELMKEQARNATLQMEKLQGFVMHPRDVMTMTKESSNGLDQLTRQISGTYENILNMQQKAVEQILQLTNTGGSETVALIKEGLDRASSFAEKFIGGKTKEATVAQQSQAQIATAQATAMQAQASALATQAAMQRQKQAEATSGLNGAAAPQKPAQTVMAVPVAGVPAGAKQGSPPDGWHTGPVPPIAQHRPEVKRKGKTDVEWFGPIMPQVSELRAGVDRFIESLKMTPHRLLKNGRVDGIEPDQCADAILQAAAQIAAQQIPINAMMELFGQGLIADFMDVLLPDAPQPYRDEVAQIVWKVIQDDGDGEDADDDDDDDDDGAIDGKAVIPAQAPTAPTPAAALPPARA